MRAPSPFHSSRATPAPGRWRALGLIGFGVVGVMATWFSATAIAPELVVLWSLTPGTSAWLTIAVQLGFVTGAVAASLVNLPDIMRMTRLITASTLLAALANLGLLAAPGPGTAIALRFLTGVALAGVYPPAMKLMATWFIAGRGLAMGLLVAGLCFGSALPHLVRALTFGLEWQVVVMATSAAGGLSVLIFGLVVREGPFAFPRAVFNPRQTLQILRDRPVMLANLGYFGHMWELYAAWAWMLAFGTAASAAGLAPFPFGSPAMLAFLAIAMGAPGSLVAGWLSDRIGRCLTTIGFMVLSLACAALIGLTFHGPGWLLAGVALLWGATVLGDSAQFSTAVSELAPPELAGTALTLQLGIGFALTIPAIQLIPLVAGWLGSWQWAFLALVPGPLVGIAAMALLYRLPQSRALAQGRR
ncbi:nitrate/nitrite transporter [Pseudooceanicola sp. HF7]|uniref:MFS transporter n=1 Tax=Pseudooceanicola sp. HF7 TaxID=2721560 RepID=UPI00143117C6|nr:MFS transporter [Pseudooceanicola sp. HF7]NIZ07843.1 MFS transporter [Pseudooceanicola sp. HF7]